MRIKSISIVSFGGLKNKTIDFTDGFNVLYGDNENGKTTVMSFLKMMFYGGSGRAGDLSKSPRRKYKPWDGGIMAGSVDFEKDGRRYRLEREFKSSDSTDKITLTDLSLGTRESFSGDVGKRILGLSADAFERSVFIGQLGAPTHSAAAEGELNARLSNLVATGEEDMSFETVNKRLEDAKQELTTPRKVGKYDQNVKQLDALNEQLKTAEQAYADYDAFQKRAAESCAETERLKERAAALQKRIDTEQDAKQAEQLRGFLETKERLDRLNEALRLTDGGCADKAFVSRLTFALGQAENAEREVNAKQQERARIRAELAAVKQENAADPAQTEAQKCKLKETQDELAAMQAKITEKKAERDALLAKEQTEKNRKKPCNPALLIAALFVLCVAVVLFAAISPLSGGVTAAVGVLLGLAAFLFRPIDKKAAAEIEEKIRAARDTLTDLQFALSDLKNECTRLEAALQAEAGAGTEWIEQQVKNADDALAAAGETLSQKQDALFALYARYGQVDSVAKIKEALPQIAENAERQNNIKIELNAFSKTLGGMTYEEARERLKKLPQTATDTVDFGALKTELESLNKTVSDRQIRLAAAQSAAEAELKKAENPERLQKSIQELTETIHGQAAFCRAADAALAVLKDSFAELRQSYGSELEKKAGEIFAGLTGGQYEGMQISKSFEIHVQKTGVFGGKESGFLSSGTADQAYLSLRLALSALIFGENDRLPIFLDDALTQYDDRRTETALRYLKNAAENGQIILFTCHRTTMETAKQIGADCQTL